MLSVYGLKKAYEGLCTKPIPDFIDHSSCFKSVVGDTTIMRGGGMELGQLVKNLPRAEPPSVEMLKPFNLEVLRSAFTFKETAPVPVQLLESEKGVAIGCVKVDGKDRFPPAQSVGVDQQKACTLEALQSAFTLKETAPVQLLESKNVNGIAMATGCVKIDDHESDKEKGDYDRKKDVIEKTPRKRRYPQRDNLKDKGKEKNKEVVWKWVVNLRKANTNPASMDGEGHSRKHLKKTRK